MIGKRDSKRAGQGAAGGIVHARQGDEGRMPWMRGTLPAIQASARRRGPRPPSVASAPRKPGRAQRTPGPGGRLAAAIRTARLRASRAAEESGALR